MLTWTSQFRSESDTTSLLSQKQRKLPNQKRRSLYSASVWLHFSKSASLNSAELAVSSTCWHSTSLSNVVCPPEVLQLRWEAFSGEVEVRADQQPHRPARGFTSWFIHFKPLWRRWFPQKCNEEPLLRRRYNVVLLAAAVGQNTSCVFLCFLFCRLIFKFSSS